MNLLLKTQNNNNDVMVSNSLLNPTLVVHRSVRSKIKRFIDILGAIVGLTITAIIAIPIAKAMQLDDPGPILYSQIRCGLNGKHFRIWKFRSMIVNADKQKHLVENQAEGHIFKNENDPRVTNVGRFYDALA